MGDLKPCPFCGGESREEATVMDSTIRCLSCRLCMSEMRGPLDAHTNEAMPIVRKRWNARSGSQGVEVSEELAETVARMFCNTAIGIRSWSKFTQSERDGLVDEMRAALLAVMGGRGEGADMRAKLDEIDMLVCDPLINEWVLRDKIRDVLNRDVPPPTTISEERP